MPSRLWWGSLTLGLSISIAIGGISPSFAIDQVNVTLDGVAIGSSSAPCSPNTVCVNIAGGPGAPYGGLTFAPVTGGCATINQCARVHAPLNDGAGDSLQIANTRITNNSGGEKTFTLIFWQENLAPLPSAAGTWYNTYVSGEFGPVAGNKIVSAKTFVKLGAGGYTQAGNTISYTVSCLPDNSCLTLFTKKTGAQRSPSTSVRAVKSELVITLKNNSYVDLETVNGDHGDKIIAASTPPDGTAVVGENATEGGCPDCTPKSQLSAFCSTTYSTARMFGCPSCVTEDGQVATDAKVKLFASTNWDNLSQDMSRGHGEHLVSLAQLLQIPTTRQPEFFQFAQEQYTASNVVWTPEQIAASLKKHGTGSIDR